MPLGLSTSSDLVLGRKKSLPSLNVVVGKGGGGQDEHKEGEGKAVAEGDGRKPVDNDESGDDDDGGFFDTHGSGSDGEDDDRAERDDKVVDEGEYKNDDNGNGNLVTGTTILPTSEGSPKLPTSEGVTLMIKGDAQIAGASGAGAPEIKMNDGNNGIAKEDTEEEEATLMPTVATTTTSSTSASTTTSSSAPLMKDDGDDNEVTADDDRHSSNDRHSTTISSKRRSLEDYRSVNRKGDSIDGPHTHHGVNARLMVDTTETTLGRTDDNNNAANVPPITIVDVDDSMSGSSSTVTSPLSVAAKSSKSQLKSLATSPIKKKSSLLRITSPIKNPKKTQTAPITIGAKNCQKVWKPSTMIKSNVSASVNYSDLYATLGSHAKVREAIRATIAQQEKQEITNKSHDIVAVKDAKDAEYFDTHILGSSGIVTSFSPYMKKPKLAPTKERLEREKAKLAFQKDHSEEAKVSDAVRKRMFRAMQTGVLDLRMMGLEYIPASAWSTLMLQGALATKFLFTGNNISDIEPYTVPNMAPADFIDFSRNKLSTLPDNFGGGETLKYLTKLHINFNPLISLPDAVMTISTLEELHVDDTTIGSFPDDFKMLKKLKALSMCRSQLSKLPGMLHTAVALERLEVCGNKLVSLAICAPVKRLAKKEAVMGAEDPESCWEEVTDPKTGHTMYYNKKRKIASRFKPAKVTEEVMQDPWASDYMLDNGWMQCYDVDSGYEYYFNTKTQESTWDIPDDAVSGEEEVVVDGSSSSTSALKLNLNGKQPLLLLNPSSKRAELQRKLLEKRTKKASREVVEAKKRWLAKQNMTKIEVLVDGSSDAVYYRDNFSSETFWQMPTEVNHLGELKNLRILKAHHNEIRDLPSTIIKLTSLRVLGLDYNKLTALPDEIGKLVNLEELLVSYNRIRFLPDSIGKCKKLKKLTLNNNKLTGLPETVGTLLELETLWLMDNMLTRIPGELGFIESLKEITLHNNTGLKNPTEEVVFQGIEAVKWHLRQQKHTERRGPPPEIKVLKVGCADEVLLPDIRREVYLDEDVKNAEESKVISIHWKGLDQIPSKVLASLNLVELRLVGNNLKEIPESINLLVNLETLILHSNKIEALPKTIGDMKSLKLLNVEENRLSKLQNHVCRIRHLEELYLAHNRLTELPEEIYFMKYLRKLIVSNNFLTGIPDKIGGCKKLEHLVLNYNKIKAIPPSIGELTKLKYLSLCVNEISTLPETFGSLPSLEQFRFTQNNLVVIPDSFSTGDMTKCLKELWMDRNKLLELNQTFCNLALLSVIKMDLNPMRSPPNEIFRFGISRIIEYCTTRNKRIEELKVNIPIAFKELAQSKLEMIRQEADTIVDSLKGLYNQFMAQITTPIFDVTRLTPHAAKTLQGDTGCLTVDDLREFDATVDQYVNANYYDFDLVGADFIEDLVKLYVDRERGHDYKLISDLLEVLEITEEEEACDEANFLEEIIKPWGQGKEMTEAYAITLTALFDDTPDIESVLTTLKRDHGVVFPYTKHDVQTTIARYKDPYGRCGSIAEVLDFPECDCLDADGDPIEKPHKPCKKVGLVLKKLIYSDEEAERRQKEKEEYQQRSEQYYDNSISWLLETPEGQIWWKREMKASKVRAKRAVKACKAKIAGAKASLQKAKEDRESAEVRRVALERGEPKALHQFNNQGECDALIQATEERITACMKELHQLEHDDMMEAVKYQAFTEQQHVGKLKSLVKDKEDTRALMEVIREGREYAFEKKLRRPWDGKLGIDFKKWSDARAIDILGGVDAVKEEEEEEEEVVDNKKVPLISKGYVPGDSDDEEERERKRLEKKRKQVKFRFHDEDSDEEIKTTMEQIRDVVYEYTG